jgi:hypothetical protein
MVEKSESELILKGTPTDPPWTSSPAATEPAEIFTSASESRAVAQAWLPKLVEAESRDRNRIRNLLLEQSQPEAIAEVALSDFRATARESSLLAAASLLEGFGSRSWPTLRAMAQAGLEECELFLGLIANCEGIPERERIGALVELARRGHSSTRAAIFEKLSRFREAMKRVVLQVLAQDRDEEIRAEAQAALASLGD